MSNKRTTRGSSFMGMSHGPASQTMSLDNQGRTRDENLAKSYAELAFNETMGENPTARAIALKSALERNGFSSEETFMKVAREITQDESILIELYGLIAPLSD